MFTGIVTDVGRVRHIARSAGTEGARLTIATAYDTAAIALGASIACSGVCLTVVAVERGGFAVEASAETLSCSTLGEWEEGTPVNLERALRAGDELGGHIVSGHVDGVGRVAEVEELGGSARVVIEAPAALAHYIAPKGSIAVNGVSLTVNAVDGARFEVNLIPHTREVTAFRTLARDGRVNIEVDMLARYVERMLHGPKGA